MAVRVGVQLIKSFQRDELGGTFEEVHLLEVWVSVLTYGSLQARGTLVSFISSSSRKLLTKYVLLAFLELKVVPEIPS